MTTCGYHRCPGPYVGAVRFFNEQPPQERRCDESSHSRVHREPLQSLTNGLSGHIHLTATPTRLNGIPIITDLSLTVVIPNALATSAGITWRSCHFGGLRDDNGRGMVPLNPKGLPWLTPGRPGEAKPSSCCCKRLFFRVFNVTRPKFPINDNLCC